MRQTSGLDGIGKGADQRILADQTGEIDRPVFAGQDTIRESVGLVSHRQMSKPNFGAAAGGRLDGDPNRKSLRLLPSGPDRVGDRFVHRQPSVGDYIRGRRKKGKQIP